MRLASFAFGVACAGAVIAAVWDGQHRTSWLVTAAVLMVAAAIASEDKS